MIKKVIKYIIVGLVLLTLAFVGGAYLLPGNYNVKRSIVIDAPIEKVFSLVGDLKNRPTWVPWAIRDPERVVVFSEKTTGVGANQKWTSEIAIDGKLEITRYEPPHLLEYVATWVGHESVPSTSLTTFELTGKQTRVTWTFEGALKKGPYARWFGFFYFDRFVGADLDDGLVNLKNICEKSANEENNEVSAIQPVPLTRAHAHNDYKHGRPLLDALELGFTSFEADIHLVEGELLVARKLAEVKKGQTLQTLYLEPLLDLVAKNRGYVYVNGPQVTLFVDIKTESEATYLALSKVLNKYSNILTQFGPEGRMDNSVVVVVTGNRPRELMETESIRYAAYDGRMSDLESDSPSSFMSDIADNWLEQFTWRGVGEMPPEEVQKLRTSVEAAHSKGRRIRFWGTPDKPGPARLAVWRQLIEVDIDLINTDDLKGLQIFLSKSDPKVI